MYGFHGYLVTSHSGLRWLLLIIAFGSIGYAINGLISKREVDDIDDRLNKFTVIFAHIQLVIGLILYFLTHRYENIEMSNQVSRFWGVEHLAGMIVGIALITVGRALYKRRKSDAEKFKATVIYFSLGMLIILATIPWPFREALGRGWF